MILGFVKSLASFKCAISMVSMQDPVLMADGHSYERAQATTWLEKHISSPKTGAKLPHRKLMDGIAIKQLMDDYFKVQEVDLSDSSFSAFWQALSQPNEDKAITQLSGKKICFKHLVKKDEKDHGRNAVHKACERGHFKIFIEMLNGCDEEADLQTQDSNGLEPLEVAVMANQVDFLRRVFTEKPELLQFPAAQKALQRAELAGKTDIASFLREHNVTLPTPPEPKPAQASQGAGAGAGADPLPEVPLADDTNDAEQAPGITRIILLNSGPRQTLPLSLFSLMGSLAAMTEAKHDPFDDIIDLLGGNAALGLAPAGPTPARNAHTAPTGSRASAGARPAPAPANPAVETKAAPSPGTPTAPARPNPSPRVPTIGEKEKLVTLIQKTFEKGIRHPAQIFKVVLEAYKAAASEHKTTADSDLSSREREQAAIAVCRWGLQALTPTVSAGPSAEPGSLQGKMAETKLHPLAINDASIAAFKAMLPGFANQLLADPLKGQTDLTHYLVIFFSLYPEYVDCCGSAFLDHLKQADYPLDNFKALGIEDDFLDNLLAAALPLTPETKTSDETGNMAHKDITLFLAKNFTYLTPEQHTKTMQYMYACLSSPRDPIKQGAIKTFALLIPELKGDERTRALRTLLEIEKYDHFAWTIALLPLAKLIPKLKGDERKQALARLLKLEKHLDWQMRESLCIAIGNLTVQLTEIENTDVLTALLRLAKDERAEVRASACQAIGHAIPLLPAENEQRQNALIFLSTIENKDHSAIGQAARKALGAHTLPSEEKEPEGSKNALKRVLACANSDYPKIKADANISLAMLIPRLRGDNRAEAIEALVLLGKSEFTDVRAEVCRALEMLIPRLEGNERKQMLALFLERLISNKDIVDPSDVTSIGACNALVTLIPKLAPDERMPFLPPLLAHAKNGRDDFFRAPACSALGVFIRCLPAGDQKNQLFGFLLSRINDISPVVKESVCAALADLAPALKGDQKDHVLVALLRGLTDHELAVRDAAATALKVVEQTLDNVEQVALFGQLALLFRKAAREDVRASIFAELISLQHRMPQVQHNRGLAAAAAASPAPATLAM